MELQEALEAQPDLRRAFDALTEVGDRYDGVYLVGGAVRDILLGKPSFDVDIAVEGDAIALGRALAERLGGDVRAHDQFGTAVVSYGKGGRIDLAAARTEHYEAPAVLPVVQHAPLEEDLVRRDFTVNAMAMSVKGTEFGRLVDPFGGRDDLAAGTIRVLHDRSFVDDPTRIFRAVRYENRFGFRMDEHTEELAREAIAAGHVRAVSPARLRDELQLLLDEGGGRVIYRLGELGLDEAVQEGLLADEEAARLFDRAAELDEEFGVGAPRWRLGLAVLARGLAPDLVRRWAAELKLRRRDAQELARAVELAPRLAEELSGAELSPAQVVALVEPTGTDAPLLTLARVDLDPLRSYFRSLRDVTLSIGGSDLAELGLEESPRVGEILAELRRRKLNGELDGRESELAAARELIEADA